MSDRLEYLKEAKKEVWRFYSLEEARNHHTSCSNWPKILEDLERYIGKVWYDPRDIRYRINGNPVYREYKIIGIEDNEICMDYYWILEDDSHKIIYRLTNDPDFYKTIILY